MAESAALSTGNALLTQIYNFTLNLLRRRIIDSIDEGDISLGKLRVLMQTQFERLHDKLDKILSEAIKSANENVILAMIHLERNTSEGEGLAKHYFLQAEQKAITAFNHAGDFEAKITATRMRLLCSFHLMGYFRESCDTNGLGSVLQASFNQLVQCTEVQSALQDATQGRSVLRVASGMLTGSGKRAERLDILTSLVELRSQLVQSTQHSYDILMKDGRVLDAVNDIRPASFKSFAGTIERLCLYDELLYAGDYSGTTDVWDTNTMKIVRSINAPHPGGCVRDIVVNKSIVCILYTFNSPTYGYTSSVVVYDSASGSMLTTLMEMRNCSIGTMCISNNRLILCCDGKPKTFDLASYSEVNIFAFNDIQVRNFNVKCTAEYVYFYTDMAILIYNSTTLTRTKQFHCVHNYCVYIAASAEYFCVSYYSGAIVVYDATHFSEIASLRALQHYYVCDLCISRHRLFAYICKTGGLAMGSTREFASHVCRSDQILQSWDVRDPTLMNAIPLVNSVVDMAVCGNRMYVSNREITVFIV